LAFSLFESFASRDFSVEGFLEISNGRLVVNLEVGEFSVAFFLLIELIFQILDFSMKLSSELVSTALSS